MGIFFESRPVEPTVEEAILRTLDASPKSDEDARGLAKDQAHAVGREIGASRTFKTGRFVGAVALFGGVAAFAWYAEVSGLEAATDALWGLATTAFGAVLGFVAGEAVSVK